MSLFERHKLAVVIIDEEDDADLFVSRHGFSQVSHATNSSESLNSAATPPSNNRHESHAATSPKLSYSDLSSSSSHKLLNASSNPLFNSGMSLEAMMPSLTPKFNCSSRSTSRTISNPGSVSPQQLSSMLRGTVSAPLDLTNYDETTDVGVRSTSPRRLRQSEVNSPIDLTRDDDKILTLLPQSIIHPNLGIPAVNAPVNLICDTEEIRVDNFQEIMEFRSRSASSHNRRLHMGNSVLIDLDDSEDSDAEDNAKVPPESRRRGESNSIPRRNPPIKFPLRVVDECIYNQFKLRCNKTAELVDGDFLRIQKIVANNITGETKLIGHRLQRQKDLNAMLARMVNEVVVCYEVDLDDTRELKEQAVVEIPLNQVVKVRSVRFTNHLPENFRYTNPAELQNMAVALTEGGLTVRWKYTTSFISAAERQRNTVRNREWALERIKPSEASASCSVAEISLRLEWRGETVLGGAHFPKPISQDVSDRGGPVGSWKQPINVDYPISQRKRRRDVESLESRRVRLTFRGDVEETRRRLSSILLPAARSQTSSKTRSAVVDLCGDDRPTARPVSRLPQTIDLSTSDLATPPPSGEIPQSSSSARQRPKFRALGQKFTFGDAFCGAGGTTRGAEMAGVKVVWGFDKDNTACKTWRRNFKDAECYEMEAFEFNDLHKDTTAVKVDILHMSPPCQFFSPAHTRAGPNDEDNSASLFAVLEIIRRVKPRVVTLEQTFGLLERVNYRMYFNGLVHMFTNANFSVRWRLVPLQEWGLPARRTRLVMIASCPGEILPRMPLATHSEKGGDGLKPFATVNQAISGLGPDPNLDRPFRYFTRSHIANSLDNKYPIKPYDGNKHLPKAITCSGGGNWHPNGNRDFTLKEYAALQGFPQIHKFSGRDTAVKKQIGNAVPPIIAKVLFESIIKDLNQADGIIDDGCIHIE